MKIILLKDVQKIGRKYDVKNVSDGHALNFLIPNGQAEIATPAVIKKIEKIKAEDTAHKKVQEDLLIMNLKTIEGLVLEVTEKANEKGHLFAGLHKEEIIERIRREKNIELLSDFVDMDKPIKEVGEHTVLIKVKDRTAKLKIIVKAK